jgi:hypothetical protein
MSGKAILILLLIAASLGGVLLYTDKTPPVEKTDEAAVLEGRSLATAKRIRWQFEGAAAIELGPGEDGRFELREPLQDLASIAYLKPIVHSWDTAMMHAVKIDDTEEGRARAGLSPPALKLIVEWAEDDKRLEVEVGAVGPLGTTRFLRVHNKIWEGGDSLLESMRVGLDDMRERQVFRHAYSNASDLRVVQANVRGEREPLHLKMQDGEWRLLEPISGRADPVAAQRFVTAVCSLRVDNFQIGLLKPPEGEPDIEVSIDGIFGQEKADLWLEEGQIYGLLPGRGYIFTSSNQQFGQVFVNAANNLRARILVPMGESTFEELAELIIDPGQGRGKRIRLQRDSQASPWRMLEPIDYDVRATPVNESAHALHRLVARAFITEDGIRPRANDPRYGMSESRWMVTTRRVRSKTLNTLWFGGDAPPAMIEGERQEMIYCCRADELDNIAVVPKQAFETLQRAWSIYCDKQILRQPAVIERLELSHKDGRTRAFYMTPDGWVLDGVEGDRDEVGNFASDVLRDFVGKLAVDMSEGFAAPDWQIKLKRATGDVLGLLKVWDRGEGEVLIVKGRSEEPVGFEVSKLDSNSLRGMWQ